MLEGARGLYAIVDPELCAGRAVADVARAILAGGCAALQLRDKRSSDRARLALARALRAACSEAKVPFIVDDRVDVALLAGADAVHLGQLDLSLEEARSIAPSLPIGVSTHDLSQLEAAVAAGAAYVGFGPVFPTRTKRDPDPVVGLEGLGAAAARSRVPVVAIGGIDAERASSVGRSGAHLGAAISAVCGSTDPRAAAAMLHAALGGRAC